MSKKRKRKSIDDDKTSLNSKDLSVLLEASHSTVSLSTVVAAAAVVEKSLHSDLYEDESGDSNMEQDSNKSNNSSSKSANLLKQQQQKSEFVEFNSDTNTRSDFEQSDANNNINQRRASTELKEVKRKKFDDLAPNYTTNTTSKKVKSEKTNESSSSNKQSNSHHKHISSSSSSVTSKNSTKVHHHHHHNQKQSVSATTTTPSSSSNADKSTLMDSSELYCICKSTDSTRFMIACDKCDEWYHGDCVGVTQSLSKKIKIFYCHLCRQKKSSLKIKYKSQFQEMNKNLTKEHVRQHENSANGENLVKFFKETQVRKKKESELIKGLNHHSAVDHKSKNTKSTNSASHTNLPSSSSSNVNKSINPATNTTTTTTTMASPSMPPASSFSKPLETTVPASNLTETSSPTISSLSINSSKCYGKTNVSGEDIANFFSAITKLSCDVQLAAATNTPPPPNPPHTGAGMLTNDQNISSHSIASPSKSKLTDPSTPTGYQLLSSLKKIKPQNLAQISHLTATKSVKTNLSNYNSENSNSAEATDENETDSNEGSIDTIDAKSTNATESDENNLKNEDEEEDGDSSDSSDSDFPGDGFNNAQRSNKTRRKSQDSQRSTSAHLNATTEPKTSNLKLKTSKPSKKAVPSAINANKKLPKPATTNNKATKTKLVGQNKPPQAAKRRNRAGGIVAATSTDSNSNKLELSVAEKLLTQKNKEAKQCLGPECVREAYEHSKYCSYECGMRLAKDRLVNYLKTRFDHYQAEPCFSSELNQSELERINVEIDELKEKLSRLEKKHADLDKIVIRAKYEKINPNVEKEREKLIDSSETEIYCVTCGQGCSERHALKHMEKCFNKLESQAFFGSFYKTHIEGKSMFCDYYNAQTKMYCKRLKVMCPEHEKEKKINDDEVCGCPLPKLIEQEDLEDSIKCELCLAPKRTCSVHFKWEKLRRAQIDLEKLRAWLKMEELLDQKKAHETSLTQRGGLLSVLLNQTTINNIKLPLENTSTTLTTNTNNQTQLTTTQMDLDIIKNEAQIS
jgi:COMPASS component SPP1